MPAVSVIIPTYNRAHVLSRALESVFSQTSEDYEVLVIDDGSTDGTEALVAGCVDGRLRYLRQPENRGVSAARIRGLRAARGTHVAFLDSDDEWFPPKLERQLAVFEASPPTVGLVYSGVETVRRGRESWIFTPEHRGDVYKTLLFENPVHTGSSAMIRRDVVGAVGGFDEGLPAIEDYDYWLRIGRRYAFDFVPEPLIRYHDHRDEERKSLDVQDNVEARRGLFAKHAEEMRRAGTAHLFLLESFRRARRDDPDNRQLAGRLLWQALRERPWAPETHARLWRWLPPDALRTALRDAAAPIRRQTSTR